jgi:nicotinamide mononucleotide transporter
MLEKIAVVFGLANIILTVLQNIWCWPVGVVMVSLYIYIFFVTKLYSDALLNVFFLVMQFYGWYHWTRGPVEHAKSLSAVTRLTVRE